MIECPQVLTLTAGVPFRMACFVNKVAVSNIKITSEALETYSYTISNNKSSNDTIINILLTKNVTTLVEDILVVTDSSINSGRIRVKVIAASLQSMTFLPVEWQRVTSPHEISRPFLVKIELLD